MSEELRYFLNGIEKNTSIFIFNAKVFNMVVHLICFVIGMGRKGEVKEKNFKERLKENNEKREYFRKQ